MCLKRFHKLKFQDEDDSDDSEEEDSEEEDTSSLDGKGSYVDETDKASEKNEDIEDLGTSKAGGEEEMDYDNQDADQDIPKGSDNEVEPDNQLETSVHGKFKTKGKQ